MNKLEVQGSGESSDALNSSHDFIPTKDDKEKGNEDTPRQEQSTSVASLSVQQLQDIQTDKRLAQNCVF